MRRKIGFFDAFSETMEQLGKNGCILVVGEQGNPMAIGWGTVGIVWGRPVFIVLVRPSRYSFGLIENCSQFSVNVPTESLKKEVTLCGTKSGRDIDKVKRCNFTLEKGKIISVPYIKECSIHYECKIIHKNNVINAALNRDIAEEYYPKSDLHTVYFGEIVGVYREEV